MFDWKAWGGSGKDLELLPGGIFLNDLLKALPSQAAFPTASKAFKGIRGSWKDLELLPGGVLLHDLLQHPPVGTRLLLGDAAAALQVQRVHLLADVVLEHRLLPPDALLERRDGRPCDI